VPHRGRASAVGGVGNGCLTACTLRRIDRDDWPPERIVAAVRSGQWPKLRELRRSSSTTGDVPTRARVAGDALRKRST